jgi:hypothetical protein
MLGPTGSQQWDSRFQLLKLIVGQQSVRIFPIVGKHCCAAMTWDNTGARITKATTMTWDSISARMTRDATVTWDSSARIT